MNSSTLGFDGIDGIKLSEVINDRKTNDFKKFLNGLKFNISVHRH